MSKRDSLKRRPAFRSPQARFLVVCEGTRTEPGYFKQKRHLDRSLVELEVISGGVPKTLVERAVAIKRAARKDPNLDYDEVWCAFDIDEHPFVPEAKLYLLLNCCRGKPKPSQERRLWTHGRRREIGTARIPRLACTA